jgi:hypothetical protein
VTVPAIADDVERRAQDHPLSSVTLDGHGEPGSQWLSDTNYLQHTLNSTERDGFGRIGRSLAPGGEIELGGCNVAEGEQGQELLAAIAQASGHDTRGGTARQLWMLPGILGPEVLAHPDGSVETHTNLLKDAYGWLDKHVPW